MPFTRPWYDEAPSYGDNVVIPRVWMTFLISLLVHVAALMLLYPILKHALSPGPVDGPPAPPLSVQLAQAPASRPPPAPVQPPQPQANQAPPPPQEIPRRRPTPPRQPPVVAMRPQRPNPDAFRVPPPPVAPAPPALTPTPQPQPRPPAVDMQSYIAAQRAARGEASAPSSAAAPESDAQRRDRIVAQNMQAVNKPQAYAGEPKNGGGLFEVTQVGYDSAQFKFFGWNRDISRRAAQVIDVRKGQSPDINTAMVRKMIEIIRETVTGDFTWRSDKAGHDVTLSARPEDNAALEEFLLRDMFGPGTPANGARH